MREMVDMYADMTIGNKKIKTDSAVEEEVDPEEEEEEKELEIPIEDLIDDLTL